jgi:hypothetical protein
MPHELPDKKSDFGLQIAEKSLVIYETSGRMLLLIAIT